MTCRRCHGLLVTEHESLSALSEVAGRMGPTMRCINCGYLEDPVVRVNRFLLLWQLSRRSSSAWQA